MAAADDKTPAGDRKYPARFYWCPSTGPVALPLPLHACTPAFHTADGEGRNSGATQACAVMPHHATNRTMIVATVTPRVLPLPGRGYTFAAGSSVVARGIWAGAAASRQTVSGAAGDDEGGVMVGYSEGFRKLDAQVAGDVRATR